MDLMVLNLISLLMIGLCILMVKENFYDFAWVFGIGNS
jgi:hypothetical protein